MPTNRELQREVELLRRRLRENENLLQAAATKAENMMALQDKYEEMRQEVQKLRSRVK